MQTPNSTTTNCDMAQLDEDTGRSMTTAAEALGDRIDVAKRRLAAVLESAQELAGAARDKAIESAKSADAALHQHPYQAIGIAFTLSAVIGFLVTRRCNDKTATN